jgi:hypothetical protein
LRDNLLRTCSMFMLQPSCARPEVENVKNHPLTLGLGEPFMGWPAWALRILIDHDYPDRHTIEKFG